LFPHFWMLPKNFPGCDDFQNRDNSHHTNPPNRLKQKMKVVRVNAYLQRTNLITLLNLQASFFQR
jgi:hypothetical protein